jgi:hypothetical protein
MTEHDPLDDLVSALFSAARRERPRDDVRSRILEAALAAPSEVVGELDLVSPPESPAAPVLEPTRSSRHGAALAFALALAALLGGVVLYRGRSEPVFSIGPERSSHRDEMPNVPPRNETRSEPAPVPPLPVSPAPSDKSARSRAAARARDAAAAPKVEALTPASLPDEIAALDRVRTALSSGDSAAALRGLDDFERVLHGTRLVAEATMLRIDALARSGRAGEASDLAARFVEANPGNALADRARAFIRKPRALGADAGG